MKPVILFVFTFLGFILSCPAQSPYALEWKKETTIFSLGIGISALGFYARDKTELFNTQEVATLDSDQINSLDRPTVENYSLSAKRLSDALLISSAALNGAFLLPVTTRNDVITIGVIGLETAIAISGVTLLTKYTSRRARPFVYHPDVPQEEKEKPNAKASFFSGHASISAASTFFCAKVFSDYYPDSKWKPIVWGAAASLPAAVGFFRVKAGKHFPTDVITGYLLGASFGVLIPHLHKKDVSKSKKVSMHAAWNGLLFSYHF